MLRFLALSPACLHGVAPLCPPGLLNDKRIDGDSARTIAGGLKGLVGSCSSMEVESAMAARDAGWVDGVSAWRAAVAFVAALAL
jgi:hypothetical protein